MSALAGVVKTTGRSGTCGRLTIIIGREIWNLGLGGIIIIAADGVAMAPTVQLPDRASLSLVPLELLAMLVRPKSTVPPVPSKPLAGASAVA